MNGLNAMINLTGNFGFIGLLNTAENLALTDDELWRPLARALGALRDVVPAAPAPHRAVALVLGLGGGALRVVVAAALCAHVAVSLVPCAKAAKDTVGARDLFVAALGPDRGRALGARAERALGAAYAAQRPWRLCNYQAKFGAMHDYRWEVVLEASRDGRAWQPYEWKYKLNAGGRGVALWLHLPRLDWRVWFLPLYARRALRR